MNELLDIFKKYQTQEIQESDEKLIDALYASITQMHGTIQIKIKMDKFLEPFKNQGNFIAQENCNF